MLSCESLLTPDGGDDEDDFTLSHDFGGVTRLIHSEPITLTWSQIAFARFESTVVERSVLEEGDDEWVERTVITDPLVTSWTDTLNDDGTFRYRVRMLGAGGESMEARTEQIVIRTTSITVPNEIECLQEAFDSPFTDDGDTLLVSDPTPCTVPLPVRLIGKDVVVQSVAGREATVLNKPGTIITMNRGVLRGFTFVRSNVHLFGTAVMEDCEFRRGFGDRSAVLLEDSAKVFRSVISNRTTWTMFGGGEGIGAGITVKDHATVQQCWITTNTSLTWGGGLALYDQATVKNCIIDHNYAEKGGGGIYIEEGATPVIINTVVHANSQAVFMRDASPTYLNTIIWDNRSASSGDQPWTLASYCNIQGYQLGTGNISTSPNFVDPSSGDYRLQPDSPCVDAGHPGSEYNDPDGSRNDMGAFGGPGGDW